MFSQGGLVNEKKFVVGVFDSTNTSINGAYFSQHTAE